ncbi:hypothetical protein BOTBODRAFT_232602 [Botryobasidium botryosum FD-172 SS1]|uniref:Uncharacterized protein n=1 Tax=Botryobasidium botryosum (strain FD-172 SS1) TaxID=930990 RepID=A0A067M4Z7_BOTB1|nr:hypothetical protein BOTBODRAFT_232602 [Botryobasidium botryosum FD-172 SS1]
MVCEPLTPPRPSSHIRGKKRLNSELAGTDAPSTPPAAGNDKKERHPTKKIRGLLWK